MRVINILIKGLLFVAFACFFSSCSYMQVKYTFEKDGSGKMEMGAEMGQAMQMMQMMGGMEEENGGGGSSDNPMMDLFKNMDGKMDTVIRMADVMPDSVRGTAEGDAMESWNMRMTGDPETKELYMGMETRFENLSEIKDKMKAFEEMSESSGGVGGMGAGASPLPDDYFSKKMVFTGKSLKIAPYQMPEDKEMDEMMEEADPMVDQMMGNMNVRMVYEVPGKVKKVKYNGPWELIDDYTVLVEYTMEEFNEIKTFPPMIIKWK